MRLRAGARTATLLAAAAMALSGCGSGSFADLPPAATPAPSPPLAAQPAGRVADLETAADLPEPPPRTRAPLGRGAVTAVLSPRGRTLTTIDAATGERLDEVPVGIGPTHVTADGVDLAYVSDTAGDAVLVVRLRPRLQVVRRAAVAGGPYAMTMNRARDRLYVAATATNELVVLTGDARPRELARRPSVRQPDAIAVQPDETIVVTSSASGAVQVLAPDKAGR